jgi:hypothetical protein
MMQLPESLLWSRTACRPNKRKQASVLHTLYRLVIFERGQLFETGFFAEIKHIGVESAFFNGI